MSDFYQTLHLLWHLEISIWQIHDAHTPVRTWSAHNAIQTQ